MQLSQRYLFVYGTLMQASRGALGNAERERLFAESRHLGSATMSSAELYDLGEYPGLSDSANTLAVVHGEVVELLHPERTLIWLDDYEGLAPPEKSEYVRAEREISLECGERVTAWVYVLQRDVPPRQRIVSGRWSAR